MGWTVASERQEVRNEEEWGDSMEKDDGQEKTTPESRASLSTSLPIVAQSPCRQKTQLLLRRRAARQKFKKVHNHEWLSGRSLADACEAAGGRGVSGGATGLGQRYAG